MNNKRISAVLFFHIFDQILSVLTKFLSIVLKYVKIVNDSVIEFISKYKGGLLNCSVRVFWLEFMLFFQIQNFFRRKNGLFSPLPLIWLGITFKLRRYTF